MAIRVRRGLEDEFDPSKLLAGEWAVTIDPETERQKVYMCFGAGIVKQMGTYNDFQQMVEEIADDLLEDFKKEIAPIKTEIEQMASDVSSDKAEVVVIKNDITDRILPLIEGYVESAEGFAESAGTSSANARTYAGNALASAELSGDYATLAESYAKGGTGTRPGEDADNAKAYMERAEQAAKEAEAHAGGDFVTHAEVGVKVASLVEGKVPESQLPEIGGKVEVDGTTITQNPDTKVISVAKDITDKVGEVDKLKEDLDGHKDALVMSAEGVHGFRYHEEKLEAQDEDGAWHEIETGGTTTSKIIVTTPSDEFIGEDVILSYLDGTVLQTLAFDETKVVTFEGLYPSMYIVSCMDSTKNVQVISIGETYNVELKYLPNGDTALPINDVQIWLACAELDKPYTTISQVLADTDTLYLLMSDENAMKYLARSTYFADSICANETAMTYLGQSAYCENTVLSSSDWITTITFSSYMNKVFNSLIPSMTSETTPEGIVVSNNLSGHDGGTIYGVFGTANVYLFFTSPAYIGYVNKNLLSKKAYALEIKTTQLGAETRRIKTFNIEGYNGTSWESIISGIDIPDSDTSASFKYAFPSKKQYEGYRLYITAKKTDTYDLRFRVNVYGK